MSAPAEAASDPIALVRTWLDEARNAQIVEPNAMVVATVSPDLRPSARVVLLRGLDERGFVFYTNYESAKGRDMADVPRAAAVFYWGVLERQLRIEGRVARTSPEESDAYFAQRPRGHRLSAWASAQSTVVPDRPYLERRMAQAAERFAGEDIERPPYWGGFRIVPERIEFWHGYPDRLHDRIVFVRDGARWRKERLSP